MVFYHGTETWNAPRRFTDHFGERYRALPGGQQEAIPRFSPGFLDVRELFGADGDEPPERLSREVRLVFLALKYGPTAIENVIKQLVELMDGITDPYLGEDVAWYVFLTGGLELRDAMMEYAKERRMRTAEEAIMTAADKLIEEGKEGGRVEGRLEAKQEMLTRLLDRRFGLTPEERELIAGQSEVDRLDAAIDAFATEREKSEVLKHLNA